jgi:hypothetical protein
MAYESLESVINALKKYQEYLGALNAKFKEIINRMEGFEDAEDLSKKVGKVKRSLSTIEADISNFLNQFSSEEKLAYPYSKPIIVQYKNWEEFKKFSSNAELISFLIKESEKFFQVTAFKNGKIMIYSGHFPEYATLLKTWISKELNAEKEKVVEGVLTF